jgi:hypothetical protein
MTNFVRTYTERFDSDGILIAIQTFNEDGSESNIPPVLGNSDYQRYLAWLENPEEKHFTPIVTE